MKNIKHLSKHNEKEMLSVRGYIQQRCGIENYIIPGSLHDNQGNFGY